MTYGSTGGGMSERGKAGGEASLHSQNMSASELAMYLKGADFPAGKQDLIKTARSNGAPENVINMLNKLPGQQFNSSVDVEKEFNKIK